MSIANIRLASFLLLLQIFCDVHGWIMRYDLCRTRPYQRQKRRQLTSVAGLSPVATDTLAAPQQQQQQQQQDPDRDSAYRVLLGNIASCLIASDLKHDDGTVGAATGWTAWIDEASAYQLQSCLNLLRIVTSSNNNNDAALFWTRWFQSSPVPFTIDMSKEVRNFMNDTILGPRILETLGTTSEQFLNRIFVRILVLPSGSSFPEPLMAPTGAMVYGKLLYGGVTRFRLVGAGSGSGNHDNHSNNKIQRRAGERQLICSPNQATRGWLQYGGAPRNYVAVDMGPCLVMEIELLPKGPDLAMMGCSTLDSASSAAATSSTHSNGMKVTMATGGKVIPLEDILEFQPDVQKNEDKIPTGQPSLDVRELEAYFCTSTGGLRRQIDEIVRRVLDGRVVRPAEESDAEKNDSSAQLDRIRKEEMKSLLELGLRPPKGLLLYGPPGCGKTQLAREISTILNARPPKIVAAPELLDRWVGGSEKMIRELFADAEAELRACNGDATESALHVIVIDECDAVFRKRSDQEGASESTRASAVNQLLSKLDGVNALENILLIGMTNRKELLDPALLRPGRLEVHVEIPLPDQEGRREILKIHFDALRKRGRLSQPLIKAIDGHDISLSKTSRLPWKFVPHIFFQRRRHGSTTMVDLASDACTKSFSGADIAGLVRCAGSIALSRTRAQDEGNLGSLLITLEDMIQALDEIKAGRI